MAQRVVTTVHELVTFTKLNGCAQVIRGTTQPEGWSFAVVVLIGSPGNERVVDIARQVEEAIVAMGAPRTELAVHDVIKIEADPSTPGKGRP